MDKEIAQALEKGQLGRIHKVAPLYYHLPKNRFFVPALAFATVISGVNWYFQNEIWGEKNRAQEQIIQRVDSGQTRTSSDFLKNFSYYDAPKWQGTKVKLDGILGAGRFIVKRNRGDQQGYIVFAPYTVSKSISGRGQRKFNRMFLLNLGWIPKSSKHMIPNTCNEYLLGENDYTQDILAARRLNSQDNLNRAPLDEDQYVPISTVTAYVRTGQKQCKSRGYINNWQLRLFKFIDLGFISRILKLPNFNEASTIYLDRAVEQDAQGSDSLPIQTTKEQVISQLKKNVQWNETQRKNNVKWVTAGSFVGALLVALL